MIVEARNLKARVLLETPINLFVNGALGVLTGIALLYLAMKVLAITLGRYHSHHLSSKSKTH